MCAQLNKTLWYKSVQKRYIFITWEAKRPSVFMGPQKPYIGDADTENS